MSKFKIIPEWVNHEVCLCAWPTERSGWSKSDLSLLHQEIIQFVKRVHNHGAQKLYLVLSSELDEHEIKLKFSHRINVIKSDYKDVWLRDIAPINILDQQTQKPLLLNPNFNAWGAKYDYELDDKLTSKIFKNLFIKDTGHIFEGGAIETNGDVILVNQSCFDQARNYQDIQQAQKDLNDIFDIPVLFLDMPTLKGDDTDGHIDTMLRFITPHQIVVDQRVAVSSKWSFVKSQIQSVIPRIEFFVIPSPDCADLPGTYANFYFSSPSSIIIPSYGVKEDKMALDQFRTLLPNFQIESASASFLVRQFGSWHCYASNIFKEEFFL